MIFEIHDIRKIRDIGKPWCDIRKISISANKERQHNKA